MKKTLHRKASRRGHVGALLLLLFAARLLDAQPVAIEFNTAATKITFILGDVLHTVRGTFQLKQGHVQFDPEAASISGDIIVDATSGNSGSGARDRRMNKDILESQRYPEIRFTPTKLSGPLSLTKNNSSVTVTGIFEIHGQRHELAIPVDVQVTGANVTAQGKFIVPYVLWGMKDPSTFVLKVDKKVAIEVSVAGRISGVRLP